ncbi:MAG: phospholipid-binding protein MlaC [Candidatus Methylomirabilia bacterium]
MMRRFLGTLSAVALLLAVAAPALGAPTDELRTAVDKVTQILDDPALKPEARAHERQDAVRAAVVDLFDFTEISRRAMARHWRGLTDLEREEFVILFRAFLARRYLPKIALYGGERVRFLSEAQDGNLAVVRTQVVTRNGAEVPVNFRLHRPTDRWLIYDITAAGVSLVANYRAQFNQIIRRTSVQGLVRRIKRRVERAESRNEARSSSLARRR